MRWCGEKDNTSGKLQSFCAQAPSYFPVPFGHPGGASSTLWLLPKLCSAFWSLPKRPHAFSRSLQFTITHPTLSTKSAPPTQAHTHTHTHIFQQRAYYSSAVCFTCVCMVHVVRAWRVSQNSCFHTNAIFVVMWSTVLRTVHHTLNADTGEIPPVTRPCGRDYCCRAAAGAALSTPNDVVVVLKSRSPEVPKSRSLEAVLLPTMHVYNKRAIQFSSLAERWIPSCDLGTRVVRHVELLMFVYFAFLT